MRSVVETQRLSFFMQREIGQVCTGEGSSVRDELGQTENGIVRLIIRL